jgi:hypothetical protein
MTKSTFSEIPKHVTMMKKDEYGRMQTDRQRGRKVMPIKDGYKTIDVIMEELGATEEQVRALIALLKITPTFFPDDRRRRFYSLDDVNRMKKAISQK